MRIQLPASLNPRSIGVRTKLIVALSGLMAVIALFIYLYFPARLRQQATDALVSRAHSIADMTAYSASAALYFDDHDAAAQIASGALQDAAVNYIVIEDLNGAVFTEVRPGQARLHGYHVAYGSGAYSPDGSTFRTKTLIEFNGQEIGNLYMGFDCIQLNELMDDSRAAVGLLSLAVFLGGLIVVYVIGSMISGPLERMVDVAEDIAAGNLSRRVDSFDHNEISRLGDAFNNMVSNLQAAQAELHDQNRHLEERVESRTVELMREINERQAAESALKVQESFLRQVIDIAPNLIFVKDRNGRFTLVNQAMADAYGTTVENLIGKRDADFNSDADETNGFLQDDLSVMDSLTEKFVPEEIVTDATGRKRWWQTIKRPLVSADGVAHQVLGVSTDITSRKEAEEALRASEEQLRQALKMEAIGKLAGGVAHDFNNILAVIMGRCEIMLATMRPDNPLLEPVREVDAAASRASALTRQLLAFSRRQVLEPRPLSLNSCVENMSSMLKRLIGEHIQFQTSLDETAGTVMADPGQMEQVVMNLAVNARDAMPNGGTLTVSTTNIDIDAAGSQLSADVTPGRYVSISVADTGHGMSESVRSHIFEPFFTTKGTGKGTGLGLSTVYGIVKQSSGHILVESAPGQGTKFTILLPRSDAIVEVPRVQEASPLSIPDRRGHTILLVEDEESVRHLVEQTLTMAGYSILTAANGVEAQERARPEGRVIDLVITDVIMPGLTGPDVVAQLRKTRPELRAIFMSGYADLGVVNEDILGAGHALLQKPFRLESLRNLVAETLSADLNVPKLDRGPTRQIA